MKKWKKISSKVILDTPRFKVREDLVELPNGKTKRWPYWWSRDSTLVIGMTKDRKIVLIRQYRYLVEGDVIEFPAGGLEDGENIEEGAKREFEEETGYIGKDLIKLGSFYETYGQLNRQIHIFFCKNIVKSKQHLDRGRRGYEDIKVELIDFDKAIDLALKNKIVATCCTLAVLLLQEKIRRGEIKI